MIATATPARYYAARADGRYRVLDGLAIDSRTEGDAPGSAYVATCSSRAKAEEKAAALNAEAEPSAPSVSITAAGLVSDPAERAKIAAERRALRAAAEAAGRVAVVGRASLAERAAAAVASEDAARAAAAGRPAAPRPADRLRSVWVGWSVVDLVLPRVDDADPAVASVAGKLLRKTPDGANARTIRMTEAERVALSAVAAEIETDAVTAGNGRLARAAAQLRGRLSA